MSFVLIYVFAAIRRFMETNEKHIQALFELIHFVQGLCCAIIRDTERELWKHMEALMKMMMMMEIIRHILPSSFFLLIISDELVSNAPLLPSLYAIT